jgi:hypothetical protein
MAVAYRTREQLHDLKRDCWRSPWRAVKRDENDHPTLYLQLSPTEMHFLATTGSLNLIEPVARRHGLIVEESFEVDLGEVGDGQELNIEILQGAVDRARGV